MAMNIEVVDVDYGNRNQVDDLVFLLDCYAQGPMDDFRGVAPIALCAIALNAFAFNRTGVLIKSFG